MREKFIIELGLRLGSCASLELIDWAKNQDIEIRNWALDLTLRCLARHLEMN